MNNPDYYELRAMELIQLARSQVVEEAYQEDMKSAIVLLNLARMSRGGNESEEN